MRHIANDNRMTVRINAQGAATLATRIAGYEDAQLHSSSVFLLTFGACVVCTGDLLSRTLVTSKMIEANKVFKMRNI